MIIRHLHRGKEISETTVFLKETKKAKFICKVLVNSFGKGPIENIPTENITTWFMDGRKALQRLIEPAQNIIGTHPPRISNIG